MAIVIIHIPKELDNVAPELKQFFYAMIYKLKKNAHKGKWEDMDLAKTLARLREETEELAHAISDENPIEVVLEAADIANFALMVSDIALNRRMQNGQSGEKSGGSP